MIFKYIMKLYLDRDCVKVAFMLISFAYVWLWFSARFILMKQTLTKSVWDLVWVFSHFPIESDDPFKWLSLNPLEIVTLKYHFHVFLGMISCHHAWVNHIFYCSITHNCAIYVLDLWPKTHSTIGQQSTVSHTRCLFLVLHFLSSWSRYTLPDRVRY